METKQTRKEPQTTIAVNQNVIKELDNYLKDKNLSRKEFVEKAIKYFVRTGFDLNSSVYELTPLQNVVEDLKTLHDDAKIQNDAVLNLLKTMYNIQNNYVQKALPAQEILQDAEGYKFRYFKIKNILTELASKQNSVRMGKIKRLINDFLDL